ncbi:hypothetical protein D3C76_790780 [compost metagenome]
MRCINASLLKADKSGTLQLVLLNLALQVEPTQPKAAYQCQRSSRSFLGSQSEVYCNAQNANTVVPIQDLLQHIFQRATGIELSDGPTLQRHKRTFHNLRPTMATEPNVVPVTSPKFVPSPRKLQYER